MHKTKIFLLTVFSLTMLIPFGSGMNTSSNAMALTEDLYPDMTTGGVDYSHYDKFYKDANFRENYYNYHKQQHQNQQSSYDNNNDYDTYGTDETTQYVNDMADYVEDKYQPYAKDNNYVKSQNSEFVKKVKCNNINANLNGVEANIGTGDSLDGIMGAESRQDDPSAISFGNSQRTSGNFDVDCINNNDNTGIGPAGPAGVQGPSGITQLINGTNIYLVQDIDSGDGAFLNALAICDPGDFVLNGGYLLSGNRIDSTIVNQNGPLIFDIPSIASPGQAWGANVVGLPSGLTHTLQVNAYCFDNPPLRP